MGKQRNEYFHLYHGSKTFKKVNESIKFDTIHESNKPESSLWYFGWGQYFYVTIFCFQNALKQVGFTKQTVSKVTDLRCSIEAEDHCHFKVAISPYKNFTKELRTSGFYQTYCMKSSLLIQGYSEDTISLVMKVD